MMPRRNASADSPVRLRSWGGGCVGVLDDVGHRRIVTGVGRPQSKHAEDDVAMRREVTTVDELRVIVGHPNSYVANKVGSRLSAVQQDWLAHSPLGFRRDDRWRGGRVDVSPKGDPPGFVHVIDDTTIAIPERPGNKRVDGYLKRVGAAPRRHAVSHPRPRRHVADQWNRADPCRRRLFRRDDGPGQAADPRARDRRRGGVLPLRQGVFFGRTRGTRRKWNPTAVPSVAQLAQALKKDMSLAELEKYYARRETCERSCTDLCALRSG